MEEEPTTDPGTQGGPTGQRGSVFAVDDPMAADLDVNFAELPGGFEIRYSDRIASDYHDLVDQSADWLEDQLGVLNLGQVDFKILVADGPLTDQVKMGLTAWWAARVSDLRTE